MMKLKILLIFLIVCILALPFLGVACAQSPDYTVHLPLVTLAANAPAPGALAIGALSDNRGEYPGQSIPAYARFEITFSIQNSVATNFQLPFSTDLPAGVDAHYAAYNGISVDALFLPPGETDWGNAILQPAFYYAEYESQVKPGWDRRPREWNYPTGHTAWKARFAPHQAGDWQYKILARDAGGASASPVYTFRVAPSANPGFIRVSARDPRYFEFDNGQPFHALGFNSEVSFGDPELNNRPAYESFQENGVNLVRTWISGIYGAAWLEWLGGRNMYDGYLPRPGVEAYQDSGDGYAGLALRVDYESEGDAGWYDGCRFQFWSQPEAVKTNTNYRLQITYRGQNISGPRRPESASYGLVGKIGGDWEADCYEPGTSTAITTYGGNTAGWETISGIWNSGENNFLPRTYLGMENATAGKAYIRSISLREVLPGGQLGPEILREPSIDYHAYFPDQSANALDQVIRLAEEYGVYLKLVIMDKNDMIYQKLDDDGTFVLGGESDNQDGFYGAGRSLNKTRWLQQAWWRYLQARWGYSTSIHSWELTNEGDPWNVRHYELADELGKFMHCGAFGVAVPAGDGARCTYRHPNAHLVTTSFWHSFPAEQFWMNARYPNVDYADLHAYVSTSRVGLNSAVLDQMQWDAALYHLDHSAAAGGWDLGKPVVRGEAGIDSVNQQTEQAALAQDHNGVWLHNYLWAGLDPGGLYELYWWQDNLAERPGPDGQPGLMEAFSYLASFLADIPLNNGEYVDAQAIASSSGLRVTGQKDPANQRAHLWVQNKRHTWKNVVDGASNLSGLSGTVNLGGFTPNHTFTLEWHQFTTLGAPTIVTTQATSNTAGELVLPLPTALELADVGIKIYP